METKDDIKNTAKYMDDSLLHKDDSDEGGSGDEEVQKKKSTAQKRPRKNSEGSGGEPKPRRQSKSSRVGAPPPRKRQSRSSEKEKPDVLKKYESKLESELAKSQSLDIPPKRARGRPKLTEEEKQMMAEKRDHERIKKNLAQLKKAQKDAEKTKGFIISARTLMDREKMFHKVQDAVDDTDELADKAQFGFVHCDRSFIDKFLALKNNLKVKGMVFQTTMAYDVDPLDDEEIQDLRSKVLKDRDPK